MTPETKWATIAWKQPSFPTRQKFKTTPSAKKVMATVFWDHPGVLLDDFLIRGATVNATSYCATLNRLRKAISRKRPECLSKSVLLMHDNARPPAASLTRDLEHRFWWEVFEHAAYSPDLAPSDFHLFEPLKKQLGGRNFRTYDEVQQAVVMCLQNLDSYFFYTGCDTVIYWWSFDNHGDYVKKQFVLVILLCCVSLWISK